MGHSWHMVVHASYIPQLYEHLLMFQEREHHRQSEAMSVNMFTRAGIGKPKW